MTDINELSDAKIREVANFIGELWWDARGLEALAVYEYVRRHEPKSLAAVLDGKTKLTSEQELQIYRQSIIAILDSDDVEARSWAERAVANAQRPQAQVIDPFLGGSLLILASCIGVSTVILAGRLKKAGTLEFEKGVPSELTKIVKAAVYAPVDMVKALKGKIGSGIG